MKIHHPLDYPIASLPPLCLKDSVSRNIHFFLSEQEIYHNRSVIIFSYFK